MAKKRKVTEYKMFIDKEMNELKIMYPLLTLKEKRIKAMEKWNNSKIDVKASKETSETTCTRNNNDFSIENASPCNNFTKKNETLLFNHHANMLKRSSTRKVNFDDNISIKLITPSPSSGGPSLNNSFQWNKPAQSALKKPEVDKKKYNLKQVMRRSVIFFNPEKDEDLIFKTPEKVSNFAKQNNKNCSFSYKTQTKGDAKSKMTSITKDMGKAYDFMYDSDQIEDPSQDIVTNNCLLMDAPVKKKRAYKRKLKGISETKLEKPLYEKTERNANKADSETPLFSPARKKKCVRKLDLNIASVTETRHCEFQTSAEEIEAKKSKQADSLKPKVVANRANKNEWETTNKMNYELFALDSVVDEDSEPSISAASLKESFETSKSPQLKECGPIFNDLAETASEASTVYGDIIENPVKKKIYKSKIVKTFQETSDCDEVNEELSEQDYVSQNQSRNTFESISNESEIERPLNSENAYMVKDTTPPCSKVAEKMLGSKRGFNESYQKDKSLESKNWDSNDNLLNCLLKTQENNIIGTKILGSDKEMKNRRLSSEDKLPTNQSLEYENDGTISRNNESLDFSTEKVAKKLSKLSRKKNTPVSTHKIAEYESNDNLTEALPTTTIKSLETDAKPDATGNTVSKLSTKQSKNKWSKEMVENIYDLVESPVTSFKESASCFSNESLGQSENYQSPVGWLDFRRNILLISPILKDSNNEAIFVKPSQHSQTTDISGCATQFLLKQNSANTKTTSKKPTKQKTKTLKTSARPCVENGRIETMQKNVALVATSGESLIDFAGKTWTDVYEYSSSTDNEKKSATDKKSKKTVKKKVVSTPKNFVKTKKKPMKIPRVAKQKNTLKELKRHKKLRNSKISEDCLTDNFIAAEKSVMRAETEILESDEMETRIHTLNKFEDYKANISESEATETEDLYSDEEIQTEANVSAKTKTLENDQTETRIHPCSDVEPETQTTSNTFEEAQTNMNGSEEIESQIYSDEESCLPIATPNSNITSSKKVMTLKSHLSKNVSKATSKPQINEPIERISRSYESKDASFESDLDSSGQFAVEQNRLYIEELKLLQALLVSPQCCPKSFATESQISETDSRSQTLDTESVQNWYDNSEANSSTRSSPIIEKMDSDIETTLSTPEKISLPRQYIPNESRRLKNVSQSVKKISGNGDLEVKANGKPAFDLEENLAKRAKLIEDYLSKEFYVPIMTENETNLSPKAQCPNTSGENAFVYESPGDLEAYSQATTRDSRLTNSYSFATQNIQSKDVTNTFVSQDSRKELQSCVNRFTKSNMFENKTMKIGFNKPIRENVTVFNQMKMFYQKARTYTDVEETCEKLFVEEPREDFQESFSESYENERNVALNAKNSNSKENSFAGVIGQNFYVHGKPVPKSSEQRECQERLSLTGNHNKSAIAKEVSEEIGDETNDNNRDQSQNSLVSENITKKIFKMSAKFTVSEVSALKRVALTQALNVSNYQLVKSHESNYTSEKTRLIPARISKKLKRRKETVKDGKTNVEPKRSALKPGLQVPEVGEDLNVSCSSDVSVFSGCSANWPLPDYIRNKPGYDFFCSIFP